MSSFETKTPCLHDAVGLLAKSDSARATLGHGDLLITRWGRSVTIDTRSGLSRAMFEVQGSSNKATVMMAAKRREDVQKAFEAAVQESEDDDVDEYSGWRRYWHRPWEIKIWIMSKFRVEDKTKFLPEEDPWEVQTLLLIPGGSGTSEPLVLKGNPAELPEYEAYYVRRDGSAKNENSQFKLRGVLLFAGVAVAIAGAMRLRKSINVSKSYGYIKRSVLGHTEVRRLLGPKAFVQGYSGTFGERFINAKLRLVGDAGAAADVSIAALRQGSEPWRLDMATMRCNGVLHRLDKSQFR